MTVPRETSVNDVFQELRGLKAGVIVADPPWRLEARTDAGRYSKGADKHYPTMKLEALMDLPVQDLAAKDSGLLMWATFPMLPAALTLMCAWGFNYCTGGTWAKRTKSGGLRIGYGYRVRTASEIWIVGTRGQPRVLDRGIVGHMDAEAREHSRKPDEFYSNALRMFEGPALELFAREERPGFIAWGNETTKFGRAG